MAKFENDLDLPKATRIVKGKKKEIDLTADNANTKTELNIDDFKVE